MSVFQQHGVDQVRPHAGTSSGIRNMVRPPRDTAHHVKVLGVFLHLSIYQRKGEKIKKRTRQYVTNMCVDSTDYPASFVSHLHTRKEGKYNKRNEHSPRGI